MSFDKIFEIFFNSTINVNIPNYDFKDKGNYTGDILCQFKCIEKSVNSQDSKDFNMLELIGLNGVYKIKNEDKIQCFDINYPYTYIYTYGKSINECKSLFEKVFSQVNNRDPKKIYSKDILVKFEQQSIKWNNPLEKNYFMCEYNGSGKARQWVNPNGKERYEISFERLIWEVSNVELHKERTNAMYNIIELPHRYILYVYAKDLNDAKKIANYVSYNLKKGKSAGELGLLFTRW